MEIDVHVHEKRDSWLTHKRGNSLIFKGVAIPKYQKPSNTA